jgi:hypothetical protein
MEKIKRIAKKAFEEGSSRHAGVFLVMCVEEAFPDHNFRGIEMTNLDAPVRTVEGKSWHHTFTVRRVVEDGVKLWEVTCKRIRNEEPLSITVLLTNDTLDVYTK